MAASVTGTPPHLARSLETVAGASRCTTPSLILGQVTLALTSRSSSPRSPAATERSLASVIEAALLLPKTAAQTAACRTLTQKTARFVLSTPLTA